MNQYEAMFLFDPTFATAFENCEGEVRRLMERAGGEIVFCRKWDERRLAYKVKGRKRGVYVLVFFKAQPDKIKSLERDVHISENVLRVLVLRADHVTPEMMEAAAEARGMDSTDELDNGREANRVDTTKKVEKNAALAPESVVSGENPDVADPDPVAPSEKGATAVLDAPDD